MLCQQNLTSPQKCLVMTQQKCAVSAKNDESAKNTLCQQKLAESPKCLLIIRQKMLSRQKFAVSAKIS